MAAVDLAMPILVVEDNRTMVRIVRNLLNLMGFRHVDEVFDGTSALAKLRSNPYGLVISDWNMAPVTGLMLLKAVRADPALKSIPFLMMTAETRVENVVAAKEAGVNNYIVKPFTGATLKAKIVATLESDRQLADA
jgi:two-component system chemotaxis response regulator CheY